MSRASSSRSATLSWLRVTSTCTWPTSRRIWTPTAGWSTYMLTLLRGRARPSLMFPALGSFPVTAPLPSTQPTSGGSNVAQWLEYVTGKRLVRELATMKATALLHNLGQSLWLDNITRDLLNSGTLKSYIDELSVTGLTSNPTIFEHAIKNSTAYDADIRDKLKQGKSEEELFFELALDDLTHAADLFRPIYDKTNGVDGWASLEVSQLLAYDTTATLAAAKDLFARAGRPNLFIKIPGT